MGDKAKAKKGRGAVEAVGGRQAVNSTEFMKEAYEREDKTRVRWWVKTGKSDLEALLAETGELDIVRVMRKTLMGAVPIPGGSFAKVLEFKPRNYRMRRPPDYLESQQKAAVERVKAYNPTLSHYMYPVPDDTCYDSAYLKKRFKVKPELKFRFPPSENQQYGFRLGDFIDQTHTRKSDHVLRSVTESFYSTHGFMPAPRPDPILLH